MAARQKKLILVVLFTALACPAHAQTARRIVSLVPNVTEMLFAIGAGGQVVGVSSYDDFPPETKSLPRVGALLDPERVLRDHVGPQRLRVGPHPAALPGEDGQAG